MATNPPRYIFGVKRTTLWKLGLALTLVMGSLSAYLWIVDHEWYRILVTLAWFGGAVGYVLLLRSERQYEGR